MMRFTLSELQRLTGGELRGGDSLIQGMCFDTRRCQPGNLFVALPGERVDGHDFLDQARDAGVAAALVARPMHHELPQLIVAKPLEAMGVIARAWRERMEAEVIGITGSNGKTTVKEMLAAMLRRRAPVLATEGNYNNEIGLPITLSRLDPTHRYAVIEMGASRPGDIAYLADIARPRVGLVTNAARAHLAGFGSIEGVARTKGEIFTALAPDGIAIVNFDDEWHGLWDEMIDPRRRLSFGFDAKADVTVTNGGDETHFKTPAGEFSVRLQLPGRHNQANAMAATAAALALDVPVDDIAAALGDFHSLPGRLDRHKAPGGWTVIDDTYNANPASLYAGLTVLIASGPQTWLVLGDMGELGEDAAQLHAEMGQTARDLGVARLYAVGEHSRAAASAFGTGARHFDRRDGLIAALLADIDENVCCLVKGSRFMGMEKVTAALLGKGDL